MCLPLRNSVCTERQDNGKSYDIIKQCRRPLRSDLFCFQKPDVRPKCGFRGLFTAAGGSEQRGSGVSTKQRGSIEPNSSVASIIMAFTESAAKTLQAMAATVFVQCVRTSSCCNTMSGHR